MLLKNRNILLCITGSIAVYKALELVRLYIKSGANVKVLMTEASQRFVTKLSFEAISQNKVLDESSESWEKNQDYNHIDIGKWADILVVAPCSANTINKLANGIADNLLTQTVLAYKGKKVIAPAANTNMIENQITIKSLKKLKKLGFELINSQVKELACKDVGNGALAEPETIFYKTARELLKEKYWLDRSVILSGGGTVEKIDDVRYISNYSSGKMASSLALALYLKGADVNLVSTRGHEHLESSLSEIKTFNIQSSYAMYEDLEILIKKAKKDNEKAKKPYLFMVAAVSDYVPSEDFEGKLKKEMVGQAWNLKLKQNIDILNSLDKKALISIGFKAEMDEVVANENATKMLEKKNLDAVCLNILKDKNSFGTSDNAIELIFENESFSYEGQKDEISFDIIEKLAQKFANE
ncbi:bifunctional phosphopantothenoylcysteine decarboxylase/phosphopantothenate--cysteine ligase CoaBC [Arcobacter sp. F155]|uniref:bifunctional phosphopantothenoylcysteine decarboxylase/phosphopantothenate--cysteine ligase CoaBC n=1 Tax=Arcobacter sp. F155 TaxID=2044512 RepID=UPI00100AE7AE|nr:bifunctional phosphopantothenoylcysteine decarboxylase/phosphopantothenate--cysteine ligase CoaBC [Arcobacter sp. F155]RXJ77301.1 bifunctional phosphopantothenoylcysteine decarboxylase/phosphopantothenate--cysteine ligase CoaBC [Arcobacter sp. F155]